MMYATDMLNRSDVLSRLGDQVRRHKRLSDVLQLSLPAARQTHMPKKALRGSALIEGIRRLSPEWADRIVGAKTGQDFHELVATFMRTVLSLEGPAATPKPLPAPPPDAATTPQTILHYLQTNLHHGPSLKDLSPMLGYSEKYCSEVFQSLMGESFSACMKRLRVERAAHLLRDTDTSQIAIAAQLGFSDQFAFSHFFKKAVGCSPTEFRRCSIDGAKRTRTKT